MELKSIINLIRKPKSEAEDIKRALAGLDVNGAEREVADLEKRRRAALVSGDDAEIEQLDVKIRIAKLSAERASAMRSELEDRLAKLREDEAEAERVRKYRAAEAALPQMKQVLKEYQEAAKGVVDAITKIADLERLVEIANESLPAGAQPLIRLEQQIRGLPAEPERLESETTLGFSWRYTGAYRYWGEVEAEFVPDIRTSAGGAVLHRTVNGYDREFPVERIVRKSRTFRESRGAYVVAPLASRVALPGVMPGSAHFWEPIEHPYLQDDFPAEKVLQLAKSYRETNSKPAADPRPLPFYRKEIIAEALPGRTSDEQREEA